MTRNIQNIDKNEEITVKWGHSGVLTNVGNNTMHNSVLGRDTNRGNNQATDILGEYWEPPHGLPPTALFPQPASLEPPPTHNLELPLQPATTCKLFDGF